MSDINATDNGARNFALVRVQDDLHGATVKNDALYLPYARSDQFGESRNTSHWSVNSVVSDHAYGSFNVGPNGDLKGKIVVVADPREMPDPAGLGQVDTWYRMDSARAADGSIERGLSVGRNAVIIAPMDVPVPEGVNLVRYSGGIEERNAAINTVLQSKSVAVEQAGMWGWAGRNDNAAWATETAKAGYAGRENSIHVGSHAGSIDDRIESASNRLNELLKQFENERLYVRPDGLEVPMLDVIQQQIAEQRDDIRALMDSLPRSEIERVGEFYQARLDTLDIQQESARSTELSWNADLPPPLVEQTAAIVPPPLEAPVTEQAQQPAPDIAGSQSSEEIDRVNALLAGLDPAMIDGGEHVAQYLGMSDEPTPDGTAPAAPTATVASATPATPTASQTQSVETEPASKINTIELSDKEHTADRQADDLAGPTDAGKVNPQAGENDDGKKVKPLPIFGKNGYEIPKSVKAHYVAVDGKFVDRKTEQIGFEDTGRKLSTKSEDRKVIENMIAVAEAKNWGTLHLQGTEDFRRQAWMAAEVAGLESTGYKPTAQDRAAVEARREEMRIAAGEKPAERSRENTIENKESKAQDPSLAVSVNTSPAPGEKPQPVASATVPAPVVQEAPSRAPERDLRSSVPDGLPTDVKGAPLPAEVAEKILAHREEMRIRDAREQFFKRGQEIASQRVVGLEATKDMPAGLDEAVERRNDAAAPSAQQESARDVAARPEGADERQNERGTAPGAAGAQQASSREAAARLVLETEMSNLGLPEADRQALRDNLNAAISDARDKGVEIEVPEPMVVERGVSAEPSKAVEIAQKQASPVQEVER